MTLCLIKLLWCVSFCSGSQDVENLSWFSVSLFCDIETSNDSFFAPIIINSGLHLLESLPRPRYYRGRGIFDGFLSLFLCLFVSNITRKRLDRFAWNFQGRCGVTTGRPGYIFGQFRETARCRDAQHGAGFVVLSHHSLFEIYKRSPVFLKHTVYIIYAQNSSCVTA